MDFEQCLAALSGFLGDDVTVQVRVGSVPFTTASGGSVVVRMAGVLRRGQGRAERIREEADRRSADLPPGARPLGADMPESDEDTSNLFFTVGQGDDGFFVNPDLFREVVVLNKDRLLIEMPGVEVCVLRGRSASVFT